MKVWDRTRIELATPDLQLDLLPTVLWGPVTNGVKTVDLLISISNKKMLFSLFHIKTSAVGT